MTDARNPAPVILTCDQQGRDPLVAAWVGQRAATCAWRTISWWWLLLGLLGALGGAAVGSSRAGGAVAYYGESVAELTSLPSEGATAGGQSLPIDLFLAWFGHLPGAVLGGLAASALVSLLGILVASRVGHRIPAGQEPWWGGMLVVAAIAGLHDWLVLLSWATAVLCAVYLASIGFRLLALLCGWSRGERRSDLAEPEGGWPVYTVLVPLYRERAVASSILASLSALDYPREKLDVKLLLEADDPETMEALRTSGVPSYCEVVVVPPAQPKTKPRACNHGLTRAQGEFLVIYDAEDRPESDQLKQAVLAFRARGPSLSCLQAKLAYHNHAQNLLTRWFALEYNVWFRHYLAGLVALRIPVPLGGTSNHFRTAVLQQVGGWDPFNVTEDCDLGIRLRMAGQRTALLDSTTWEEANSRIGNWLRQRSRWLKGYLITHLVWFRNPFSTLWRLNPWGTLGFVLCVGCVPVLAGLNVALWGYLVFYGWRIWLDWQAGRGSLHDLVCTTDDLGDRVSWPMWYDNPLDNPFYNHLSQIFFAVSAALLVGNVLFVLITACFGSRPGQRGLWWAALLSPLYWFLISLGAIKGIWQLLIRPHYWEKTLHGLGK